MNLKLSIKTNNAKDLLKSIFNVSSPTKNKVAFIGGNRDITLTYLDLISAQGINEMGSSEIITFALTFSTGVTSGIVANILYEKLKKYSEKLALNNELCEIDPIHIEKFLVKNINISITIKSNKKCDKP